MNGAELITYEAEDGSQINSDARDILKAVLESREILDELSQCVKETDSVENRTG